MNKDPDIYIRLSPDNYNLLIDNARREGFEQAEERIASLEKKLGKAKDVLKFYSIFDFKGNPHFQAFAREALKGIE